MPTNEIMIVNPIVKKLITEGEDNKLTDAIRIGYQEGMVDFTENLRQLVERGDIDKAIALEVRPNPETAEDGLQGHQGGCPRHPLERQKRNLRKKGDVHRVFEVHVPFFV